MIILIHVGLMKDELGAAAMCTPEPMEAKWSGDRKEDLKKICKRGRYEATMEIAGFKVKFVCEGYGRRCEEKYIEISRARDKQGPGFGRKVFLRPYDEGTLRLKLKKKEVEAQFLLGDLTAKFWNKYGISEILPLDTAKRLDRDYWGPEGEHWEIQELYSDADYTKKYSYAQNKCTGYDFEEEAFWALAVMTEVSDPKRKRIVAYSNLPHDELELSLDKGMNEGYPIKMLLTAEAST